MLRKTTDDLIGCLEDAFWHFGGVARTTVIDNLKAAVKQAGWYDPEIHPKIQSFCEHYETVILPLLSSAVITDGNWHRVGFVWDGANRTLYLDGVLVAEDTLSELASASGGLYVGASGNLEEGSFWSGMIDDVRVYDRVLEP